VSCAAACAPSSLFPSSNHACLSGGRCAAGRPRLAARNKHDGFRILAHARGRAVRLLTRNGNDLANRFPLAAAAVLALPIKSCVVDAEAIVCDDQGMAVFNLIRGHARRPPSRHAEDRGPRNG
jgi:ATP-dependent DNA ligase